MTRAPVAVAFVLALACGDARAVACSAATTSVAFGAYNVYSASNDDSTGTVVVTCSKTAGDPSSVSVSYELELGTGSSGNVTQRTMQSGLDTLDYNLYRNNARSQLWGNGVDAPSVTGSFNLSNATPSRNRSHTVYGRIPPLQDATVGNYTDNVLVTIQY